MSIEVQARLEHAMHEITRLSEENEELTKRLDEQDKRIQALETRRTLSVPKK